MLRVPCCQTTPRIGLFRWPRGYRTAAPVRPEGVQELLCSEVVTTYIENPQNPLNLHFPQDWKCSGRPRVSLPEIVDAGRALTDLHVGLDGTYGPDATRYNRQRGLGRDDILF